MRAGIVLPYGDARTAATLAREAEEAGWDAFFVWEPVWGIDAWVCLMAAAMTTGRIGLGTMLTPLSRMRPWKLASETATLDNLSGGRVILAVGLGAPDTGFAAFGEETDRTIRAELLDEGLDILTGLWQGQPFTYNGRHYTIQPVEFMPPPPPVQQPRIPIWVVGGWPRPKSMRRALRYDGLLPLTFGPDGAMRDTQPDDIRAMADYIARHRDATTPYEIIMEGTTPGDDPEAGRATLRKWADAGVTFWVESLWEGMGEEGHAESFARRLRQGPPRL